MKKIIIALLVALASMLPIVAFAQNNYSERGATVWYGPWFNNDENGGLRTVIHVSNPNQLGGPINITYYTESGVAINPGGTSHSLGSNFNIYDDIGFSAAYGNFVIKAESGAVVVSATQQVFNGTAYVDAYEIPVQTVSSTFLTSNNLKEKHGSIDSWIILNNPEDTPAEVIISIPNAPPTCTIPPHGNYYWNLDWSGIDNFEGQARVDVTKGSVIGYCEIDDLTNNRTTSTNLQKQLIIQ